MPAVRLWIGGSNCLRSLFSKGGRIVCFIVSAVTRGSGSRPAEVSFSIRLLAICIYGAVSLR